MKSTYEDFAHDFERARAINLLVAKYLSRHENIDLRVTEKLKPSDVSSIEEQFFADADKRYGCDAFIFKDNKPVHGVAMRSQLGNKSTFTIRFERVNTRAVTEFEKRLKDIANGGDYPKYTIQTYYTACDWFFKDCFYVNKKQNKAFYKIGIVKTEDLYKQLLYKLNHYVTNCKQTNGDDGNLFLYVNFEDLGDKVRIYSTNM